MTWNQSNSPTTSPSCAIFYCILSSGNRQNTDGLTIRLSDLLWANLVPKEQHNLKDQTDVFFPKPPLEILPIANFATASRPAPESKASLDAPAYPTPAPSQATPGQEEGAPERNPIHRRGGTLGHFSPHSPFELLFGRDPLHFINPAASIHPDPHNSSTRLRQTRQDAWDSTQLAIARMKRYYDDKHQHPPELREGDLVYVRLAKPGHDGYHLHSQTKLSHRRTGPFPVLRKINSLRYKIELPNYLRWHLEISIEHLEPVPSGTRNALPPGPLRTATGEKYIIERIVDMRGHREGRRQFKVRWLGYPATHDTWEPETSL